MSITLNITLDSMTAIELHDLAVYLLLRTGKPYTVIPGSHPDLYEQATGNIPPNMIPKDELRCDFSARPVVDRETAQQVFDDVMKDSGILPKPEASISAVVDGKHYGNTPESPKTLTLGSAVIPLPLGTTDVVVTAAGGGGGELDSEGLPYDLRIHSRTRSQVKQTGAWKKKRGLDEQYAQQVENELRMRYGSLKNIEITQSGVTDISESFLPELPQERFAIPPSLSNSSLAVPKSFDRLIPPPPAPTAPGAFPEFCQKYTSAIHHKKITMAQGVELLQAHGISNLPLVGTKPEVIPALTIGLARLIAAGAK